MNGDPICIIPVFLWEKREIYWGASLFVFCLSEIQCYAFVRYGLVIQLYLPNHFSSVIIWVKISIWISGCNNRYISGCLWKVMLIVGEYKWDVIKIKRFNIYFVICSVINPCYSMRFIYAKKGFPISYSLV